MVHVRSATYIPTIRSSSCVVKHQSTGSTLTLSLFQLICPTAIVCHVATTEEILVIETRIVYHSDDNLTLYIDAFVVVPIVFRSIDTEAHEHEIGIGYINLFLSTECPYHNVVREIQVHTSLCSLHTDAVLFRTGKGRYFSYRLEVATIVGRLQTQLLELIGNVVDSLGFVLCQWLASTKLIGCQSLDSFLEESYFFFVLLVLCHGRHAERCSQAH